MTHIVMNVINLIIVDKIFERFHFNDLNPNSFTFSIDIHIYLRIRLTKTLRCVTNFYIRMYSLTKHHVANYNMIYQLCDVSNCCVDSLI